MLYSKIPGFDSHFIFGLLLKPGPGPWTRTLDPDPGPGTWTLNQDPSLGPWTLDPDPKTWTLKNLDPEKPGP